MKKTIERLWILFALAACTAMTTSGSGGNAAADTTATDAPAGTGTGAAPGTVPGTAAGTATGSDAPVQTTAGNGCQHVWDQGKIVSASDCSKTGLKL